MNRSPGWNRLCAGVSRAGASGTKAAGPVRGPAGARSGSVTTWLGVAVAVGPLEGCGSAANTAEQPAVATAVRRVRTTNLVTVDRCPGIFWRAAGYVLIAEGPRRSLPRLPPVKRAIAATAITLAPTVHPWLGGSVLRNSTVAPMSMALLSGPNVNLEPAWPLNTCSTCRT